MNSSCAGDEIGTQNMALEDTVNTDAFVSPKNDMFTSSPNGNEQMVNLPNTERDANIIHVNQIFFFLFNCICCHSSIETEINISVSFRT